MDTEHSFQVGDRGAPCGCLFPIAQLIRQVAGKERRYHCNTPGHGEYLFPGQLVEEDADYLILNEDEREKIQKELEHGKTYVLKPIENHDGGHYDHNSS